MLPPPLGGWNTADALAVMGAEFAPTLDNLIPEQGRLRVRPGWRTWATGLPGRVDGLLDWRSGGRRRLFAASGGTGGSAQGAGIWEVTGPGAVGAAAVDGATSARWDGLMVNATGGDFLFACNGADPARTFDGTTWQAWTGQMAPSGAVHPSWACTLKGRLYVGRSDRLSFWYGIPGGIGGAFTEFPLQGVARRGGGIAGMATWTRDGGRGSDDAAAFVTTEGEVLVYEGIDPGDASAWSLTGSYQLPRPLGVPAEGGGGASARFLREFGGDVLVLTQGGVFALGALVSGADQAGLGALAYTRKIEPSFLDLARGRGGQAGWELVPLAAHGLWLVNVPWGPGDAQQVAFSAATGAACRFAGVPAACWTQSDSGTGGRAYFGHAREGRVCLWGEDEADDGAPIAAECVGAFGTFGGAGLKRFTLAQPVLSDAADAAVRLDIVLDWQVPTPEVAARGPAAPPRAVAADGAGRWDDGIWDEASWAGEGEVSRAWRAVRGIGQAGAVRLRVTANGSRPGWLGTGLVWERGGIVR